MKLTLKDKNGVRIHEGDTIRIDHPHKNRTFEGVVIWDRYKYRCENFYFPHFDNPWDIFSEGVEFITVVKSGWKNFIYYVFNAIRELGEAPVNEIFNKVGETRPESSEYNRITIQSKVRWSIWSLKKNNKIEARQVENNKYVYSIKNKGQ